MLTQIHIQAMGIHLIFPIFVLTMGSTSPLSSQKSCCRVTQFQVKNNSSESRFPVQERVSQIEEFLYRTSEAEVKVGRKKLSDPMATGFKVKGIRLAAISDFQTAVPHSS